MIGSRLTKTRTRKFARTAFWLVGMTSCGREHLDRIPVPDPPEDRVTVVSLTSFPLDSEKDFDRLDAWLQASGSLDDTIRVYDDLLRLAPDHVTAHVRAALAVLKLDEERGRAVARGVLERFRERVSSDPQLQALSARLEGTTATIDPTSTE